MHPFASFFSCVLFLLPKPTGCSEWIHLVGQRCSSRTGISQAMQQHPEINIDAIRSFQPIRDLWTNGAVTCCNRLCDDVRADAADGECLPVGAVIVIDSPLLFLPFYSTAYTRTLQVYVCIFHGCKEPAPAFRAARFGVLVFVESRHLAQLRIRGQAFRLCIWCHHAWLYSSIVNEPCTSIKCIFLHLFFCAVGLNLARNVLRELL